MNDKILEQLHYFNIQSDVDSVFGNWVVTDKGDVVNSVYPYAVFYNNISQQDWLEDIRQKTWYDKTEEGDMKNAFSKALAILKDK